MPRTWLLLAAALVVLGVAPQVALAAPTPIGSFDLRDTFESSLPVGQSEAALSDVTDGGPVGFANATIPGAPRTWRVLRVPQGSGLELLGVSRQSWTLAVVLRLGQATGARRVLDLAQGRGDAGLYVVDGKLLFRGDDAEETSFAAGGWRHLVVTRSASAGRVYLDGTQVMTFAPALGDGGGSARLLVDDGTEETAADVARVRVFGGELDASEVAALDTIDVVAPTIGLRELGGAFSSTTTTPSFMGEGLGDEGTPLPLVHVRVRPVGGKVVAVIGPERIFGGVPNWFTTWGALPPLESDVEHEALITAEDRAGNARTITRRYTPDGSAPDFRLTEPPPTVTSAPRIRIAGDARPRPGDVPNVMVSVRAGGTEVASAGLPIVDGRFEGTTGPDLAPGTYVVEVLQLDHAMNAARVRHEVTVVPAGTAPPVSTVSGRTPSARAQAQALLTRTRSAFRNLRRRALARSGVRVRFTSAADGIARVRVFSRRGARNVLVAEGRGAARRGTAKTLVIRTTKPGRRLLAGGRRVKLRLDATFTPRGGKAATARTTLTLRR